MNKLQGKDLINVGIFTAIYFVVMMAIAMLGFIPIFLPLLIVLVPLIGGIVMMLYYSKVQKFGMVSLTGLICGILMLLTGMGYMETEPLPFRIQETAGNAFSGKYRASCRKCNGGHRAQWSRKNDTIPLLMRIGKKM